MFSLVITIISVALVAVLALAAIYYGGETIGDGNDRAEAARLVNEGQQIRGAAEMFRSIEARQPSSVAELVDREYLSTVPRSSWQSATNYAQVSSVSERHCRIANVMLKISSDESDPIPSCDDPSLTGRTACCELPASGG